MDNEKLRVSEILRPGARFLFTAPVEVVHGSKIVGLLKSDRSTRGISSGSIVVRSTRLCNLGTFASSRRYELVEIPVSLFEQVHEVPRNSFSADGPTINIPIGKDPPDFALKLDRSDAKITIANINKALCLVHGTWQL